jgi:hypothetical protein
VTGRAKSFHISYIIFFMTDTDAILSELIEQRDRIVAAIQALSGSSTTKRGRPRKAAGTRMMSAAAKKRISDAAKARWAKAKKEGRNSL